MPHAAFLAFMVTAAAAVAGSASAASPAEATAPAAASAAAGNVTETQLRESAEELQQRLSKTLMLPSGMPLDPALRVRLDAMAAALLRRTPALFATWAAEARVDLPPGHADSALRLRLFNRFANELALWWIEPVGPAWDEAMWPAWTKPLLCAGTGRLNAFGREALRLQALPPEKRETALAGEAELMLRWGAPRPGLPPPPERTAADDEAEWIAALRAGRPVTTRALPPVLAGNYLTGTPPRQPSASTRCALHQWWLAEALSRPGSDRANVIARWRDETAPRLADWIEEDFLAEPKTAAAGDYPRAAERVGLEGRVRVANELDAQGRVLSGRIVLRELRVPGVAGRPVAFERMLDEPSLARARAAAAASRRAPPADQVVNGGTRSEVNIVWRLE